MSPLRPLLSVGDSAHLSGLSSFRRQFVPLQGIGTPPTNWSECLPFVDVKCFILHKRIFGPTSFQLLFQFLAGACAGWD